MNKRFLIACFSGFLALAQARAQLAITEVMTSEADSTHPDWWEVTNFGTNNVDITAYSWQADSHGGFSGADTASFAGVIVHFFLMIRLPPRSTLFPYMDAPSD